MRACCQLIGFCLFSYPGFRVRDKCDTSIKLFSDTRNTINLVPIATTTGGPNSKESACNEGDQGSVPGSGRSPGVEWLPTPVFLPGKPHGQRSLAGYSPWGLKELDTTEQLSTTHQWQGQDKNPDLPPTVLCSLSYNLPQQFISLLRHFFP